MSDTIWPDCPKLPPGCDCSHPEECLFGTPEAERPSYAILWIVGAVLISAVAIIVLAWIA